MGQKRAPLGLNQGDMGKKTTRDEGRLPRSILRNAVTGYYREVFEEKNILNRTEICRFSGLGAY